MILTAPPTGGGDSDKAGARGKACCNAIQLHCTRQRRVIYTMQVL